MIANEPFLQAIAANPDDDAPRLIYADWLEEQGDARGEFIRLQCQLETLAPYEPRATKLAQRVIELQREFGQGWIEPIASVGALQVGFRRGFVDEATLRGETFCFQTREIFEAAPLLQTIDFLVEPGTLESICQTPQFRKLRGLQLKHTPLEESDVRLIAENLYESRARFLGFSVTKLNSRAAAELARHASLEFIETLELNYNEIRQNGARALFESPNLASLKRIDLRSNRIGRIGFESLAHSTCMKQLEQIDISENGIDPAWIAELRTTKAFENLRGLDLSQNGIKPAGVRHLIECPFIVNLERLDIRSTGVCDPGAIIFASSPRCENLVRLDLHSNLISDTGATALAESTTLTNLRTLDLSNNCIHDKGIQAIIQSPWMDQLAQLNLEGNEFSSQLADALELRFGDRVRC